VKDYLDSIQRTRPRLRRLCRFRRTVVSRCCRRRRITGTLFKAQAHRSARVRSPMRPDYEVPFAAAFDWLAAQHGVDPGAVAIIGRFLGGYLGPRAAAIEPRIAALAADLIAILGPRAMADSLICLPADLRSCVR